MHQVATAPTTGLAPPRLDTASAERRAPRRPLTSLHLHRSWKLDVATDVVRLHALLDANPPGDATARAAATEARHHLGEVRALLERWWTDLFTSASTDAVYRHLHEAEVAATATLSTAELLARAPYLVAKARRLLAAEDPQRVAVERLIAESADGAPLACSSQDYGLAYAEAARAVYEVADARYARMRKFRTNLRLVTVVLTIVVGGLVALGMRSPGAVPLCFRPQPGPMSIEVACPTSEVRADGADPSAPGVLSGTESAPGTASDDDLLVVAILGAVGGALSGALAVRKFRPPPYTPYNLPLLTFLLKVPVGALTAIGGLLLLRGQIVPGLSELDSQGQILAYALLFGFAQHLFTRYVDVHADKLLFAVPPRGNGDQPSGAKR